MSRCWVWDGCRSNGYGQARAQGVHVWVHRAAYEVLVGPIPAGLQLDHLCRNRACYNPSHLEPVTPSENRIRGRNWNAEKTHCVHGHEFTADTTYVSPAGHRQCRACKRLRERATR